MKSRDEIAARDGVAGGRIIDEVRRMRGLPSLSEERTGKILQQGDRQLAAGERRTPTFTLESRRTERRAPIRFGPRKGHERPKKEPTRDARAPLDGRRRLVD